MLKKKTQKTYPEASSIDYLLLCFVVYGSKELIVVSI